MERHKIIELMGQLKLAGMRAAYDEVITAGLRAQHPVQRIIGNCCWPSSPTIAPARPPTGWRLPASR